MQYLISPHVQFRLALKHIIKTYWHRKQKVLAADAGISEPMISYVVTGKENISLSKQAAIANAAGYSYENFIALGRMIHQKVPEANLPKPSTSNGPKAYRTFLSYSFDSKENDADYDKHGGYSGHDLEELIGDDKMSTAVSKLMKIYDSGDDKIIRILNRLLDEFCEVLPDDNKKEKEE